MHREQAGRPIVPQNQTISAILVLGRVAVGDRLLQAGIRELEAQRGTPVRIDEIYRRLELAEGTPPRSTPGQVVGTTDLPTADTFRASVRWPRRARR
jgi:hypothetical protein